MYQSIALMPKPVRVSVYYGAYNLLDTLKRARRVEIPWNEYCDKLIESCKYGNQEGERALIRELNELGAYTNSKAIHRKNVITALELIIETINESLGG